MIDFINTVLSFPTVLWSMALALSVIYWALAATGLLDIDSIDGLVDADVGDLIDGHQASHSSHSGHADTAGILTRWGLSGVPFMVMFTILSLVGWMVSFYIQLWVLSFLPTVLAWVLGVVVFAASVFVAIIATSWILRPIRNWLAKNIVPPHEVSVLGKVGTVISPTVTSTDGRAEFADGGAGLILQVRSISNETYKRGDQVVILTHNKDLHTYEVMLHMPLNVE